MLCRYTIITDTVNFSEAAKKTTKKDLFVAEQLDKTLELVPIKRTEDYRLISEAKQDTQNLTVIQCLRKDLKVKIG